MSDLRFQSDIVIESGDFALVSDIDEVKQDLRLKIRTLPYTWAFDPLFGSFITNFVNAPKTPLQLVELKRAIRRMLKTDKRIKKDSISISLGKRAVVVTFETITGNRVNMEVTLW